MGILDSAQDVLGRGAQAAQGVLDKGVTVAKGAVSGVAVEQQPFMKAFVPGPRWDAHLSRIFPPEFYFHALPPC